MNFIRKMRLVLVIFPRGMKCLIDVDCNDSATVTYNHGEEVYFEIDSLATTGGSPGEQQAGRQQIIATEKTKTGQGETFLPSADNNCSF